MKRRSSAAGVRHLFSAACLLCTVAQIPLVAVADEEAINPRHEVKRLEKGRPSDEGGLDVYGRLELEASRSSETEGSHGDLRLATVELGGDARPAPWLRAHLLILFEQDKTEPAEVDEAVITLAEPAVTPFSLSFGRIYVPFGHFESAMLSDPLTLEVGETREFGIQLGYLAHGFRLQGYLADDDTDDQAAGRIGHYGFHLALTGEGYDIGLSWSHNLADSNALEGAVTDPGALRHGVPGLSLYGVFSRGGFIFVGEYLTATRAFDAADLAFAGAGARPAAWNVEVDHAFAVAGYSATLAFARQGTRDAVSLGLPWGRWLATLAVEIRSRTTLSLEYTYDRDYPLSSGGGGGVSRGLTLQIGVSF